MNRSVTVNPQYINQIAEKTASHIAHYQQFNAFDLSVKSHNLNHHPFPMKK
jgi:hypothetical protein